MNSKSLAPSSAHRGEECRARAQGGARGSPESLPGRGEFLPTLISVFGKHFLVGDILYLFDLSAY